ncbi:MAG: hypothetical protein KKE20_04680 [Nanoarchaeota archaeon]|nr:hypothetical protein [Nanoarchaeota archaeon]
MVVIEIVEDIENITKDFSFEKMKKRCKGRYTVFMTPEVFYHTFSPERMKLLMILKQGGAMSISDLAKRVGRKFEAVHRDLRYLEGIVKFRKEDRRRIPYLEGGIKIEMIPA